MVQPQQRFRRPVAAMALVAALILSALLLLPARAFADTNYTIDELSTELTVNPDGSVHVISRQVLTFTGKNTGYTWYLRQPATGESVRINAMRVAPVDDGGSPLEAWTRLQMIDVDAEKQGQWPGDGAAASLRTAKAQPWYSYDLGTGMVRSYFPAQDGSYMIEADYTVLNAVYVYRDVADLEWRYAHASTPVDQSDVTLQIVLPVPEGAVVAPGDNVIAWGHGPHDGHFQVNEDGTVVYLIDFLETGHYGEAHVIFPANWMSAMSYKSPHLYTEMHKQEALTSEGQWVDASTRGANWDYQVRMLCLAIAAVVLLVGLVCVLRFGMTPRSRRVLVRVAAILAIEGLAAQLFFQEPFSVWCLLGLAAIVAVASLFLPRTEAEVPDDEDEPEDAVLPEAVEGDTEPETDDEPGECPVKTKEESHDDEE